METAGASAMARLRRRFLFTDPANVKAFGDPFRPLEADCAVVQFEQPLSPDQLRRAGELLAGRAEVELYVHGRASRDLDFLEWFPGLRRLHLSLWELEDIGGIDAVAAGLETFTFAPTRRRFSLRFLEAAPALEQLFLAGHDKDISVISSLSRIASLGLSRITLPDLALLIPLRRLKSLKVLLGGTRNLRSLADLEALEDLFLMRITGLSDLGVLAELAGLATLRLDWMRNVTSLPSFARLARLEWVNLDTMKGLTDLAPIASAPALRRLWVSNMSQLTAESFAPFVGHPTLSELSARTGKAKVNAAVRAMFPGVAR